MSNIVITIARSYGSGGRMIGRTLADQMNVPYYDRNLIYLASDKSGMDSRIFSEHDESIKPTLIERIKNLSPDKIPPESRRFSSHENVFRYQQKMIRELADKSDCVIIGRCANYTLRESGNKLVRVFIWAPHDKWIENVMKKFSISRDEADKTIRDINKHRREYYKYYTGCDWESATNYDLCINTGQYDVKSAAALIERVAKVF